MSWLGGGGAEVDSRARTTADHIWCRLVNIISTRQGGPTSYASSDMRRRPVGQDALSRVQVVAGLPPGSHLPGRNVCRSSFFFRFLGKSSRLSCRALPLRRSPRSCQQYRRGPQLLRCQTAWRSSDRVSPCRCRTSATGSDIKVSRAPVCFHERSLERAVNEMNLRRYLGHW